MLQAQSRDPRVMHSWTGNFAGQQERAQAIPVNFRFSEKHECRRVDPCVNLVKRFCQRCWWRKYLPVRHDRQKFVDTWPGNGLRCASLGEFSQLPVCRLMPLRVHAVRTDKDIGVNGDHPPRLS